MARSVPVRFSLSCVKVSMFVILVQVPISFVSDLSTANYSS